MVAYAMNWKEIDLGVTLSYYFCSSFLFPLAFVYCLYFDSSSEKNHHSMDTKSVFLLDDKHYQLGKGQREKLSWACCLLTHPFKT